MLKKFNIIETIISLFSIIASSMLSVYISIPFEFIKIDIYELPINLQIPLIILLTVIFKRSIIYRAYISYLLIGLLVLPVFYDGGSLGYLLTPNFGYLLGVFLLIRNISQIKREKEKSLLTFLRSASLGLFYMHFVGIMYMCFQLILFSNHNLIAYNIGKFSLSKFPFEFLMLFPISILLITFKKIRF